MIAKIFLWKIVKVIARRLRGGASHAPIFLWKIGEVTARRLRGGASHAPIFLWKIGEVIAMRLRVQRLAADFLQAEGNYRCGRRGGYVIMRT